MNKCMPVINKYGSVKCWSVVNKCGAVMNKCGHHSLSHVGTCRCFLVGGTNIHVCYRWMASVRWRSSTVFLSEGLIYTFVTGEWCRCGDAALLCEDGDKSVYHSTQHPVHYVHPLIRPWSMPAALYCVPGHRYSKTRKGTVQRLIIGEDLFGKISEFKKFTKISGRQIKPPSI